MLGMQKWIQAIKVSSSFVGLAAILLTVILWAIAANVATSLFLAGVPPFEVAGVSTMIATFGLAIIDSFFGSFQKAALHEPYLKAIFNFIGITDIQFIHANGLRTERREQALAKSRETIQAIAADW